MKRKSKHPKKWRRYETKKKAISARGLSPADYEKAIREISRKY